MSYFLSLCYYIFLSNKEVIIDSRVCYTYISSTFELSILVLNFV